MTLNEPISFYRKSQTKAADGRLTTTRVLISSEYAKTYPRSGNERNKADQTEAGAMYRFWIHQRSDLAEANLIVWNGTDYNIRMIADNGPLEPYMYIDAERGVAQ